MKDKHFSFEEHPGFQTYHREIWPVLKDSIYAAIAALKIGQENTEETLIIHDVNCGRTTKSNKVTAERLEREIAEIKTAISNLKKEE